MIRLKSAVRKTVVFLLSILLILGFLGMTGYSFADEYDDLAAKEYDASEDIRAKDITPEDLIPETEDNHHAGSATDPDMNVPSLCSDPTPAAPGIRKISTGNGILKISWKGNADRFNIVLSRAGKVLSDFDTKKKSRQYKGLSPGSVYTVRINASVYKNKTWYESKYTVKKIKISSSVKKYRVSKSRASAAISLYKAIKKHKKTFDCYVPGSRTGTDTVILNKALTEKHYGDHIRHNTSIQSYSETVNQYSEPITINGKRYTHCCYKFKYYISLKQESGFNRKLKKRIKKIGADKGSRVKRLRKIVRYVNKTKNINSNGKPIRGTAYSALMKRKSCCRGEADLFYMMCRKAKIPVRIVTGSFHNHSNDTHTMNLVKINGKWRFIDPHSGCHPIRKKNKRFFRKNYFTPESGGIIYKLKPTGYKKSRCTEQ